MANLKKFIIFCIFIFLFSFLLMSDNVSAFDMILDYDNYQSVGAYPRVNVNCNLNGTAYSNLPFCVDTAFTNTNVSVRSIQSYNYIPVKAGDLVTFDLLVFSPSNFTFSYGLSFVNAQVPNARVIGYKETFNDDLYNSYYLDVDPQSSNYGDISSGNFVSRVYTFYARVNNDYDEFYPGLVSTSATYPIFNYFKGSGSGLSFKIININVLRAVSENETNKEQEEKTQEAADASQDAGESSSSEAEAATTSLLSAIGGAVTVISSASPTNCKINGNMGHFDMGELDLCANPVPSYIQTIGSLIMIMICIPLAISLFNRFINLFRSFQN